MRRLLLLFFVAGMVALCGCGNGSSVTNTANSSATVSSNSAPVSASTSNVAVPTPALPTAAQPKLPATKLFLGAEEMIAEVARSGLQLQTGMMFRTNMAENEGMLFLFPVPHQTSFWMANTVLPLSAAYISPEGTILEIHDLQPLDTNSVVAASERVQFVLETNQGWFKRHNVREGMVIQSDQGSLQDLLRQGQRQR